MKLEREGYTFEGSLKPTSPTEYREHVVVSRDGIVRGVLADNTVSAHYVRQNGGTDAHLKETVEVLAGYFFAENE